MCYVHAFNTGCWNKRARMPYLKFTEDADVFQTWEWTNVHRRTLIKCKWPTGSQNAKPFALGLRRQKAQRSTRIAAYRSLLGHGPHHSSAKTRWWGSTSYLLSKRKSARWHQWGLYLWKQSLELQLWDVLCVKRIWTLRKYSCNILSSWNSSGICEYSAQPW